MFGGAIMMVLGAIVAGNGYGWGTWKTVFTQGPSRTATVVGSLLALIVFVVGDRAGDAGRCTSVSSAVRDRRVPDRSSGPRSATSLQSVGGGVLVLEMWALAGLRARHPGPRPGPVGRARPGLGAGPREPAPRRRRPARPVEAFTHVLPGTAAGSLVGSLIGAGPRPTHPRRARRALRRPGPGHGAGVRRGAAADRRGAGPAAGRHLSRVTSVRSVSAGLPGSDSVVCHHPAHRSTISSPVPGPHGWDATVLGPTDQPRRAM